MILAVVGSRNFDDRDSLFKILDGICERNHVERIVSGGAKGADRLGQNYAMEKNIPFTVFTPEWEPPDQAYNPRAGFERNKKIANACTHLVAFWDGKSGGTKDTIELTQGAKKPCMVFVNGKLRIANTHLQAMPEPVGKRHWWRARRSSHPESNRSDP